MAIKKLKAVSPDKLLNKGVDMKPVTTGQMNNQVIPEINTEVGANTTRSTKNSDLILALQTKVSPLDGIPRGIFTDCGAAKIGGVLVGELYVLRQSYVVNILGENQNLQTDTIVLMGEECPEP